MLRVAVIVIMVLQVSCLIAEENMTVEKLMKMQNKAIDRSGVFRKAKTFMNRQRLTVAGKAAPGGYVIQYYKVPNKSKSLLFMNGKLVNTQIFNGEKGWRISSVDQKVVEMTGKELAMQKILVAMGNPKKELTRIFKNVTLDKKEVKGRTYYCLTCYPKEKDLEPIIIYIDQEDYLPKMMEMTIWSGSKKYKSLTINEKYAVVAGVRLVELTKILVLNTIQEYRLEDFELNVPLTDSDFEPILSLND